jgi:regulator of replication initiation timing
MQDCSTCEQYQSEIDALVGELECAQRMIQSLVSENGLLRDEIVHLKHCADEERRRMEVDRTQAIASLIAENQMLRIRLDETKQAHREEMRTRCVHDHEEKHTLNGRSEQQVRWKRPPPLGITDGETMTRDSESQFVGYSPLSAGRLLRS